MQVENDTHFQFDFYHRKDISGHLYQNLLTYRVRFLSHVMTAEIDLEQCGISF